MAEDAPKSQSPSPSASPSELLTNAKDKVTGDAIDVKEAAKNYGKPDGDSGVGHYVGKSEDYLHNLHSPSEQPLEGGEKKAEASAMAAAQKKAEVADSAVAAEEKKAKAAAADMAAEQNKAEVAATADGSQGVVGGFINKAKGLFK